MTSDPKPALTAPLFSQISWTAIFIATLIGFALGFFVELLGLALSLSLFSTANTGALTIAILGMTAILAGLALAMFIAGYVAGYLGRQHRPARNSSIFYGLTTWSLVLILNALIALPLNQYLSGLTAPLFPSGTSSAEGLTLETLPADSQNDQSLGDDVPAPGASPKVLATSAFILLGLFFTGACFSCLGASRGMRCGEKKDELDQDGNLRV